jgi:hypothetical protein
LASNFFSLPSGRWVENILGFFAVTIDEKHHLKVLHVCV